MLIRDRFRNSDVYVLYMYEIVEQEKYIYIYRAK